MIIVKSTLIASKSSGDLFRSIALNFLFHSAAVSKTGFCWFQTKRIQLHVAISVVSIVAIIRYFIAKMFATLGGLAFEGPLLAFW